MHTMQTECEHVHTIQTQAHNAKGMHKMRTHPCTMYNIYKIYLLPQSLEPEIINGELLRKLPPDFTAHTFLKSA